jgi:cysteinyl-tRNA synthetase
LGFEVGAMPQTAEAAIDIIIALRDEARRAKNWSASDKLRDALQRCGVELKDSKEGTTWSVASTSMT